MDLLENYGEAEGRREAGDDKRGSSLEVRSSGFTSQLFHFPVVHHGTLGKSFTLFSFEFFIYKIGIIIVYVYMRPDIRIIQNNTLPELCCEVQMK